MHPLRSFLFAPGNSPRKVEKVFAVGADAVILDLEDAVATAEKAGARQAVVGALQRRRACLGYVRVNAMTTEFCYGDLDAVVRPGLDGVILPKVDSAWQLKAVDWLLGELERAHGLEVGNVDLMPIIETGSGMAAVNAIAGAGTRVRRLAFGAGDYVLDLGLAWTRAEEELSHARAAVVVASRAAGLEPPIDSVWVDLKDNEGFEASARRVLRMGYQGKMCIHPDQVPVTNRVFTPSDEEVANAERVVSAFLKAENEGSASIQLDGHFIDYPFVYRAQRILATIERIRAAEAERG
jgi:citrate lyase subunit beta/citryl-CoA lyase